MRGGSFQRLCGAIGLILCSFLLAGGNSMADSLVPVKSPNVAGQFYEADPRRLAQQVRFFLDQADAPVLKTKPSVIMVPHAGHIFSGPVAAYAFKAVKPFDYSTVILLGPTHYYQFDGVAIWPKGGMATPLGTVPVDETLAARLMRQTDEIQPLPEVFDRDHVLEVELPFLQVIFPELKIVPLIMSRSVGPRQVKEVADALNQAVGDRDDVLLLISTDLSHFHPADQARRIDQRGLDAVVAGDVQALWQGHQEGTMEIDGFQEVITGLLYAQTRGQGTVRLLKYGHSGDVTGDQDRVVGYAAVVVHE